MGPEATIAFYARLVAQTPATCDQDHLRVIDLNPKIPDRTAALVAGGASPVPAMVASIEALGAMPVAGARCNGARVPRRTQGLMALLVLSIFDAVADDICATPCHRSRRPARDGWHRARRPARAHLERRGLVVDVPVAADQDVVMAAIYEVKSGPTEERRAELRDGLRAVARRLVTRGAQAIVLGCTEIPLIIGRDDAPVPVCDALDALARMARRAAREP
jgi:aspartate racemase